MAKRDYIPARDGEFLSWEQNFINYCSANMTALGLVSGDLTPLLLTSRSSRPTTWRCCRRRRRPRRPRRGATTAAPSSSWLVVSGD
ncbi:MAG TPA: hypothetical protein VER17_04990 [Tepidisphaeraceae bacterium]|nr:hypothetical protein [Tepidisphaeraceae bacterium]